MFRFFAAFSVLLGGYVILGWVDALKHTITVSGVTLSVPFLLAVAASYMTFSQMGSSK